MEYTRLGTSGLEISRICMGAMSFGDRAGGQEWLIGEDEAFPIVKHALALGINFFDTANVYNGGRSEEILGEALRKYASRDEYVLATKVWGRVRPGPNGAGLSRAAIMSEIDKSLQRLKMDYVDLYILHRWDYDVPIEETMEAMNDVVRAGKARYIGSSAMMAWQFARTLSTCEQHGWTKPVSMQNHYNLIYREEEREMNPLCVTAGVGTTPYSPLASGRLARDFSRVQTPRAQHDAYAKLKYDATAEADQVIIDRVAELAERYGVPRAQIALGWILRKAPVSAPIVGASRGNYLDEAVGALKLQLSDEDMLYLEEKYEPHPVVGPTPYPTSLTRPALG